MKHKKRLVSENLFLLEFLVDKVEIYKRSLPREIDDVPGETCLSISFFRSGPMDISEQDFKPQRDYGRPCDKMKNGKSCLFALQAKQAKKSMKAFDVDVSIYKKYDVGLLPDRILIGKTSISLKKPFTKIVKRLMQKGNKKPISQTHQSSATIKGTLPGGGCCIGELTMFVRISCLGKVVVTQFQMNLAENSVFFTDRDGKALYKYYKTSKSAERSVPECNPCCPGPERCPPCSDIPPPCCPLQPCYVPCYAPCPPKRVSFPQNVKDDVYKYGSGAGLDRGKSSKSCDCVTSDDSTRDCDRDGCGTTSDYTTTDSPSECPDVNCAGPAPCRILRSDCPCERPRTCKYPSCGCTGGTTCLNDPCNCRMNRCGIPCVEKQVLSMTPAEDSQNPFCFKLSGCGNKARQNIMVIPPTSTRPDGMKVTEICDPRKDVFTLRVGQKNEVDSRKPNLELELVTRKPTVPQCCARMQTEASTQDKQPEFKPQIIELPSKGSKANKKKKGKKGKKK